MNLLQEGLIKGTVIKTDRAVKMVVDGLPETYPIYRVRLENLYFNDQNDRISTWISQYKADNGEDSLDVEDIEHYNAVIQRFITESNPDSIKKTQTNIGLFGQKQHGVVLNDGRIIDGNRRFTCLRNLSKDNGGTKYNYFETVILDKDYEHSAKQIKMLELQIQIGEEARVDYNPIDKLVGIYRDIEESKLLTIEEYATSTNMSPKEVEKQLEISKLLVEFLEAINAPGQFYIARDMDLNGPLVETYAILNKVSDEDKKQEIKYIIFTNLLMQPAGDMTRFIRNVKGIVNSNYIDEFIDKEIDVTEDVLDSLPEVGKVTTSEIAKIKANEEVKEQLSRTMDIVSSKVKATETRNKPNQNLEKAVDLIDGIDKNIIKKLTEEQRENIKDNIERLEELLSDIKEAVNV